MEDVEGYPGPPLPHRPRPGPPESVRSDNSYESVNSSTESYAEARLLGRPRAPRSVLTPREEVELLLKARQAVAGHRRLRWLFLVLLLVNLTLLAAYVLIHPKVSPWLFGEEEQKGDPLPLTGAGGEDTDADSAMTAAAVAGPTESRSSLGPAPTAPSRHREGVAFLESITCSGPPGKELCWQIGPNNENFIFGVKFNSSSRIRILNSGHYFIFCKVTVTAGDTRGLRLNLSRSGDVKRSAPFSGAFADLLFLDYLAEGQNLSVSLSESRKVDHRNTYIGTFKIN